MNNSIAIISRIRENSNKFIIEALTTNGIEGLVPSHGDILAYLFNKNKCTMKELAKNIHRTKATTTVLVDKLEKLHFLERQKSAEDNRITTLTLTQKGLSLKPTFEKISIELNNKVFKNFSNEETSTLNFLLEKMYNNIK